MVFSSILFLFSFLPVVLFLYMISPFSLKNGILLVASLFFYAWGEPIYILLMLFSIFVDYFAGILIGKYRGTSPIKAKLALLFSICTNIAILSFYKYADLLIETLNDWVGTNLSPLNLPLPIGISFYTFQTMSYSIDVYRGEVLPQKNWFTFATYVSLFPQLIAGPIVRYKLVAKDLEYRRWDWDFFTEGIKVFLIGLGKKVLLANNIGILWDEAKQIPFDELSTSQAWLGICAFSFQIYFDFSGYSDMAKGLGKMFGFHFPDNFNYPYISKSVTEFWRRWHMTLGTWFRDYVYIPLGGSRGKKWQTYRNLFVVWGLTGLWHGASWNFLLWGLYFGFWISLEKSRFGRLLEKMPRALRHGYLIFIVIIGWVIFEFDEITAIIQYLAVMFGFSQQPFIGGNVIYTFVSNLTLIFVCLLGALPIKNCFVHDKNRITMEAFTFFYLVMIFLLSVAYLNDESYNPFLYFRF